MISKDRILSNLDIIVSSPKASLNPKNSTLNPKLAKMDDLTAMIMMWNEDLMKFLNHSPESLDSSIFIILKQLCCLLIKMQKEFIANHDFICVTVVTVLSQLSVRGSPDACQIRAMWTTRISDSLQENLKKWARLNETNFINVPFKWKIGYLYRICSILLN